MTTQAQRMMTWGEAVRAAVVESPGGINAAAARIRAHVGDHIGTRTTFSKLLDFPDVAAVPAAYRFRAWLLLVAIGQEPAHFGVDDAEVPPAFSPTALREVLPRLDSNQQPSG